MKKNTESRHSDCCSGCAASVLHPDLRRCRAREGKPIIRSAPHDHRRRRIEGAGTNPGRCLGYPAHLCRQRARPVFPARFQCGARPALADRLVAQARARAAGKGFRSGLCRAGQGAAAVSLPRRHEGGVGGLRTQGQVVSRRRSSPASTPMSAMCRRASRPRPIEFKIAGTMPDLWSADDVVRIRSHGLTRNVASEVKRSLVACAAGLDADRLRVKLEPAWTTKIPEGLDPCSIPKAVLACVRPRHTAGGLCQRKRPEGGARA